VKQLYYTSCKTGKSVNGNSGFQIRAVSPNLPPDILRSAVGYVGYALPSNVMPTDSTAAKAPIRLALLNTPSSGRLLCHAVYIGKDPMTGRFGNFFSHSLFEIPEEFEAIHAIQTWKSAFWKTSDDDDLNTLPEVESFPRGNLMTETNLVKLINNEKLKEMFVFLIKAILSDNKYERIFLAAQPQEIALCIYGLVHILPKTLLKNFSFSTYESNPLGCNARVIGTWLGDSPNTDLPSSCYRGSCVGFNLKSNKKIEIKIDRSYVDFVFEEIKSGSFAKITEFKILCESLNITTTEYLNKFHLVFNTNLPLGKELCQSLFQQKNIPEWLVQSTRNVEVLNTICKEAEINITYHQALAPSVASATKVHPEIFNVEAGFNKDLIDRVQSWISIQDFLDEINFKKENLINVCKGLFIDANLKLPQYDTLNAIVSKVAEVFLIRTNSSGSANENQRDFEIFLITIGKYKQDGAFDLIGRFAEALKKNSRKTVISPDLLELLFKVYLGQVKSKELYFGNFGNKLTRECKTLLKESIKSKNKKALYIIEENSKEWDDGPKERWDELTKKIIDRTHWFRKILRETGKALITLIILFYISDEIFHFLNIRNHFIIGVKFIYTYDYIVLIKSFLPK
jgi:hypothetical protein